MDYFEPLQQLMRDSGALIMQHFRKEVVVESKSDGSIVTRVDKNNDLFLREGLSRIMPKAEFLTEELGSDEITSDYVWVVDPLDGTKNFVRGLPHFSISIALTYKNEPIVAAIYHPVEQNLYYAEKGKGSWLNGEKQLIMQKKRSFTKDSLFFVDIISAVNIIEKRPDLFNKSNVSVRYFGSAALDAAYVAAGYVDCIFYNQLHWWDVAAGILLVKEAGGNASQQEDRSFLAGRMDLYERFISIVDTKICN